MEIGEQFRAIKSAEFSAHNFFGVTRCDNNEEQLKIVSKTNEFDTPGIRRENGNNF
jgi:hypothetical protein